MLRGSVAQLPLLRLLGGAWYMKECTMKITEGIHKVDGTRTGHAYLVEGADRLALVDTGLAGSTDAVLRAVAALGRSPQDLREIIITHWHADHMGSLAELAERTGAQVCVHAADAPIVRGEQPMPEFRGGNILASMVLRMSSMMMGRPPKPSRVDRELQDGDELEVGDVKVVHTPGHTPGHIALYMPSKRVLFVGDAIFNWPLRGLQAPAAMVSADTAQAKESIRKLAGLECDIVCFGHGPALTREAGARLRRFAEGLR
jgi:glyoxylase-like metal-dependent hydrolase (beta-lactamase superfamily II)